VSGNGGKFICEHDLDDQKSLIILGNAVEKEGGMSGESTKQTGRVGGGIGRKRSGGGKEPKEKKRSVQAAKKKLGDVH